MEVSIATDGEFLAWARYVAILLYEFSRKCMLYSYSNSIMTSAFQHLLPQHHTYLASTKMINSRLFLEYCVAMQM